MDGLQKGAMPVVIGTSFAWYQAWQVQYTHKWRIIEQLVHYMCLGIKVKAVGISLIYHLKK